MKKLIYVHIVGTPSTMEVEITNAGGETDLGIRPNNGLAKGYTVPRILQMGRFCPVYSDSNDLDPNSAFGHYHGLSLGKIRLPVLVVWICFAPYLRMSHNCYRVSFEQIHGLDRVFKLAVLCVIVISMVGIVRLLTNSKNSKHP